MKRSLIVITVSIAVWASLALIPARHAVSPRAKKAFEQNCTVVADLRPDEVAEAIKKLNAKGIRVQADQIRVVDGKFAILVLDGQDDEDEEEAPK